jgi:hypothetical protein
MSNDLSRFSTILKQLNFALHRTILPVEAIGLDVIQGPTGLRIML